MDSFHIFKIFTFYVFQANRGGGGEWTHRPSLTVTNIHSKRTHTHTKTYTKKTDLPL